jgi:hypothetical protein
MPVTISYDLAAADSNDRNYIRSMLERFRWRRLGGSVFRYDGVAQDDGSTNEDWLNHVVPSLMFLRSFILRKQLQLKFFTVDAASISFLDHSDPQALLGTAPVAGQHLDLAEPSNKQSAEGTVRSFIDAAKDAIG